MPRITIEVSPETYRELKEAAARQCRSIDAVVEERLERGRVTSVEEIVARAGESIGLSEKGAMALAVRMMQICRQECLEVRLIEPARKIVADAGTPDLSDEDAMAIAVRETRLHREGR